MADTASAEYDMQEAARKLTDSGMPPEQAEAVVDKHFRVFVEHVANREDVHKLGGEVQVLSSEVQILRTEVQALKEKVEQLEKLFRLEIDKAFAAMDAKNERRTNRMYVLVIVATGLIIASQQLL